MSKHDTPAVRIAAVRDGYRRCGMAHAKAQKTHEAGTFSQDDLKRLKADRNLVVVEVTGTEPDEAPVPGDAGLDPAGDAVAAWDEHGVDALVLSLNGLGASRARASDLRRLDEDVAIALAEALGPRLETITPPGDEGAAGLSGSAAAGNGTQARTESREATIARHAAAIVAGGDPAKLTKSGKPTTNALEEATGLDDITASERDAALSG